MVVHGLVHSEGYLPYVHRKKTILYSFHEG